MLVLIDTNVLIDYIQKWTPFYISAEKNSMRVQKTKWMAALLLIQFQIYFIFFVSGLL